MSNKLKHLEPSSPSVRRKEMKRAEAKPQVSGMKMALLGIAIVLSVGFGLDRWNSVSSEADHLSESAKEQLSTAFKAIGRLQVEPVPMQEVDAAIAAMPLSADRQKSLRRAAQTGISGVVPTPGLPDVGQNRLVWLELNDFANEDGDVVSISSAGYQIQVGIVHATNRIAIPVDHTGTVVVTGVHDGGGGITLGFRTGSGLYSLPVLSVGETLTFPVSL